VVQVGGDGVSDTVIAAIRDAFNTRELLKVKVAEGAPVDARAAADDIARRVDDVRIAQVIGRTIVAYRPFPEAPEIELPR
jgi:RNA-binding protein